MYRLTLEPKRLFGRYVIGVPVFLTRVATTTPLTQLRSVSYPDFTQPASPAVRFAQVIDLRETPSRQPASFATRWPSAPTPDLRPQAPRTAQAR